MCDNIFVCFDGLRRWSFGLFYHQIAEELSLLHFGLASRGFLLLPRWFGQFFGRVREPNCRFHHFTQSLDGREITLAKCVRLAGKKFENTEYLIVIDDRHHQNGSDSQLPADFAIDAGVALGIVAAQELARAHTLTGQSKLCGEQRAQFRRIRAGAGATEHVIAAITAKCDCCATRARDVLRAVGKQLQGSVEIALRHFGEGVSAVRSGNSYRRLGSRESGCQFLRTRRGSVLFQSFGSGHNSPAAKLR
jgi:hypothetical protein